jgi:hypothetical protein
LHWVGVAIKEQASGFPLTYETSPDTRKRTSVWWRPSQSYHLGSELRRQQRRLPHACLRRP